MAQVYTTRPRWPVRKAAKAYTAFFKGSRVAHVVVRAVTGPVITNGGAVASAEAAYIRQRATMKANNKTDA